MDRLFIRGKSVVPLERVDQRNIAVIGLGNNVGTTFIASLLAFYFAEKGKSVTFTQCGEPGLSGGSIYDAVAMDKRFFGRDFADIYSKIKAGEAIRAIRNDELGVNWMIMTPFDRENCCSLSAEEKARLVRNPRDDINIFDVAQGKEWMDFLIDMDEIIAVVDPLPSKMTGAVDQFRRLKSLEIGGTVPVTWIVNGINSGVSRRQVKGFLKSNRIMWMERFPAEEIYGDEYHCRFHWENRMIRDSALAVFTKNSQLNS